MNYLVTGGAGFIGSHLVDALLAGGHHVRVLDDFSTGKLENLPEEDGNRLIIEKGDIRDLELLLRLAQGADGIFHQAALVSVNRSVETPPLSCDINARGTAHVFEAARRTNIKRVVFASSAAVYGANSSLPLDECVPPSPISPYGLDKLYTEQLAALYHTLHGLEPVPLRYFNVYGPRQDPQSPYSGVISIFARCCQQGIEPTVFGDGAQTRDFVFVQDIVQANLCAMFHPYPGFRPFNVGTGLGTSLLELIQLLAGKTHWQPHPRHLSPREGDIRHSLADVSAIRTVLGYQPKITLKEGLSALLNS